MPIEVAPVVAKNGVQIPTLVSSATLATDSSGNIIAGTGSSQSATRRAFFLSK